jgi:hypothetical protein
MAYEIRTIKPEISMIIRMVNKMCQDDNCSIIFKRYVGKQRVIDGEVCPPTKSIILQ